MVSPSFVWLQPLWWWQIHLIQLPLNEQRGTTSLWSFPFVRYIHSDYITWLSKWLCMQIIPSFLVDKGFFLPLRLSCKERLFSKTYPSFLTLKEGSTSHLGLLPSGKKRGKPLLLVARNRYALRLADHQRSRQIVRDGTAGRGKFTVNSLQLIFGGFCWFIVNFFVL